MLLLILLSVTEAIESTYFNAFMRSASNGMMEVIRHNRVSFVICTLLLVKAQSTFVPCNYTSDCLKNEICEKTIKNGFCIGSKNYDEVCVYNQECRRVDALSRCIATKCKCDTGSKFDNTGKRKLVK